jgi:sugar phosphate isomerase/epimerase
MKTALHTISYSGSWGQAKLPLEEIVQRASMLGYDGIMLAGKRPHASLLDMTPDVSFEVRWLTQR